MARVVKDPNAVAAKWGQNTNAGTAAMKAGVESVTTAPGQLAARAADLYVAQVQAAKAKFAARVGAVSLSEWQQATIMKGIPRVAEGVTQAMPKVTNFLTQFLPYVGQAQLPQRGGLEQNIQRAAAQIRHNASFQYKP